jgi:hypothetical protein
MTALNKLLRGFNKAGIKATPDKVQAMRDHLRASVGKAGSDVDQQLLALAKQCDTLLAEMACSIPDAAPTPIPRTPAWVDAADQPLSDAALGSVEDAQVGRHRRGGKVKPRPRWSLDELPKQPTPSCEKRSPQDAENYMLASLWAHRQKDDEEFHQARRPDAPKKPKPSARKRTQKADPRARQQERQQELDEIAALWARREM